MKLIEEEEFSKEQETVSKGRKGFRPGMLTAVLLGIIVILLIIIFTLLLINPIRNRTSQSAGSVEQDIMDYVRKQQENEPAIEEGGEVIIVSVPELSLDNADDEESVSEDSGGSFIVMGEEDESDISYTKEYILNEMAPHFAENNLDAVWDLAHLKRYIKLSEELEGTGTYYYLGDVNQEGKPHGRGLAIYEANSYYYGSWVNGLREGDGRWYRFYIDNSDNDTGFYQAHSYSGVWKNDLPNGEGAEHYDVDLNKLTDQDRVIQNVVGNFINGLYDGDMFANTVDYIGRVQEWDGVSQKGVFKLWRDMSSIGECSVWRNRDDKNLYMDIDKAENKNQGIRELLGL